MDPFRPPWKTKAWGFVIGGFDGNESGQFLIYQLEGSAAALNEDEAFVALEQPEIIAAQWAVSAMLVPLLTYPGMSVEAALDLAAIAMVSTAAVESTVGGPIHIATVTLAEGFSLLHEREVTRLIERNQPKLQLIRRCWLDGWELRD